MRSQMKGEFAAKEEVIAYTFLHIIKVSVHSKHEKIVLKVKLEKYVQYIQAMG